MLLSMMSLVLYGFIREEVHLIIPSLMVLVMLLIIGFIFSNYILERKYKVDENVLHLSREILHELAIPLSTIQANTLLLKRTCGEDDKSLKRLGRIEDASKRLERLYDELVYSIKKEIHSIERETFDVLTLVEERVEVMRLFQRNRFTLNLENTKVVADKIGFEKMLDNLLNNAMKYSPKESVIEVKLTHNILSIQDYGVGMDEVTLKRVFRRYYQIKEAQSGEGIGLALVKAYCDEEKIGLEINSSKGVGTRIGLNLNQILVL